jgi:hypothetical protein
MSEPRPGPHTGVSYSIDLEDRIQSVGDGWLAFACANGAPELTPAAVLGRSIGDFIADPGTRHIYGLLYGLVRRGTTLQLPFRCDAPEVERNMLLRLSPAGSGGVRCDTFLLAEQHRPVIALLDATAPRGTDFLVMCSWCKRIRHQGQWLDLEEGVRRLKLLSHAPWPELSHGVCPSCIVAYFPPAKGETLPVTEPYGRWPDSLDSIRLDIPTP